MYFFLLATSIPVVFVVAFLVSWKRLEPWPTRISRAVVVASGLSLAADLIALATDHTGPLRAVMDLLVGFAGLWGLLRVTAKGPACALVAYLFCLVEFTHVRVPVQHTCTWRVEPNSDSLLALAAPTFSLVLGHPDKHNYWVVTPSKALLDGLNARGVATVEVRFEALYHWGQLAGGSTLSIGGSADFQGVSGGWSGEGRPDSPFPALYWGLRHGKR